MNHKLLIPIIALLILLLTPTITYGSEAISLPHTVYNNTTVTYKETGSKRESWLCEITLDVTYNTTTFGVFKTYIADSNVEAEQKRIEIHCQGDKTMFWYKDPTITFQLHSESTDTYNKVEYYTVTFQRGKISIGAKLPDQKVDYDKYVKDYAIGDVPFVPKWVAGSGSVSGTNIVLTGGYVTLEFKAFTTGIQISNFMDMIMSFVPIIVLFAMLGMLFGLLKKFGKI